VTLSDTTLPFTVAGMVETPPVNSSIQFKCLIPYEVNIKHLVDERSFKNWSSVSSESYLLLKPGVQATELEKK
jgi:putative ABC transport system permease protein